MKPVVSPRRRLRSSTCCVALLALSCSVKGFPTVLKGGQLAVTCSQTPLIQLTTALHSGKEYEEVLSDRGYAVQGFSVVLWSLRVTAHTGCMRAPAAEPG